MTKDHCFFKYANLFEFSNLLLEDRQTYIEKKRKEAEERGEKFDEKALDKKPKRIAFKLETGNVTTHEYLQRKPADYLRKYDYRKLAMEIKQAKK